MNACAVVGPYDHAQAHVLAESFHRHNPEDTLWLLMLDPSADAIEHSTPLHLDDLGAAPQEIAQLRGIYTVAALKTAIKPFLVQHLFAQGADSVTVLAESSYILGPLAEFAALAADHGIVLTPRTNGNISSDYHEPHSVATLNSGSFDLDFMAIAATKDGPRFVAWWAERLLNDFVSTIAYGAQSERRWVDFVPAIFRHCVNVENSWTRAYWNMSGALLEEPTPGAYAVDGRAIACFNFVGYDPRRPWLLSDEMGRAPLVRLSEQPALARLCNSYRNALLAADWQEPAERTVDGVITTLDILPSGIELNDAMRVLYRTALAAYLHSPHEARNPVPRPPSPFEPEGDAAFIEFLTTADARNLLSGQVPRYLYSLWLRRPDLQIAFPYLRNQNEAARFMEWATRRASIEAGFPKELLPTSEAIAALRGTQEQNTELTSRKTPSARGVNVVGYFTAEIGLGEAGRSIVSCLETARVTTHTETFAAGNNRHDHPWADRASDNGPFDTSIICVNADQLPAIVPSGDTNPTWNAYRIGLWFWEVDPLPESMCASFDLVDEVWASSEYVADIFRAQTDKPVAVVPLCVEKPSTAAEHFLRDEFGIGDNFVFMFMFDFNSVIERKNPIAVVEAFKQVVPEGSGPRLVIKTINGTKYCESDVERLLMAIGGREDIILLNRYLTRGEVTSLISDCDCYVSLHRAEGFGLTMAEAMLEEKPVIATNFSGNLEFMNHENSYLVDYEMRKVGRDGGLYPKDGCWAEPSVDHAAQLMRHVLDHPEEARERARRGARHIAKRFSRKAVGKAIAATLKETRRTRHAVAVERTPQRNLSTPANDNSYPPADPTQLPNALGRVHRFVEQGPENAWNAGGNAVSRFMRKVLRRTLAPYIARQREFEVAVRDALLNSMRDRRTITQTVEELATATDTVIDTNDDTFDSALSATDDDVRPATEPPTDAETTTPLSARL